MITILVSQTHTNLSTRLSWHPRRKENPATASVPRPEARESLSSPLFRIGVTGLSPRAIESLSPFVANWTPTVQLEQRRTRTGRERNHKQTGEDVTWRDQERRKRGLREISLQRRHPSCIKSDKWRHHRSRGDADGLYQYYNRSLRFSVWESKLRIWCEFKLCVASKSYPGDLHSNTITLL